MPLCASGSSYPDHRVQSCFFFDLHPSEAYFGYIFVENHGLTDPGEKKGTKVVMIRLVIIHVGFLLAVLVSGLPVDKITVILGAFGVGTG
jgi:potassium efflux system protein